MQFRDRIKELRRVPAGQLRAHAKNWRRHPSRQQRALRGMLREVGFASAVIARECEDGSLELIDGHLRAETAADALVPVLVVDLDADEAGKLLATMDAIGGAAVPDYQCWNELLVNLDFQGGDVVQFLNEQLPACPPLSEQLCLQPPTKAVSLVGMFQVIVECADEPAQQETYERLVVDGYACHLRTM